jgi:hypothetical protein
MSIVFAARQHGPGDARQFVGDCDHNFVARSTLRQPVHPLPEPSGVVLDAKQSVPPVATGEYELTGNSRGASTAKRTVGGAAVGTIIGALLLAVVRERQ